MCATLTHIFFQYQRSLFCLFITTTVFTFAAIYLCLLITTVSWTRQTENYLILLKNNKAKP